MSNLENQERKGEVSSDISQHNLLFFIHTLTLCADFNLPSFLDSFSIQKVNILGNPKWHALFTGRTFSFISSSLFSFCHNYKRNAKNELLCFKSVFVAEFLSRDRFSFFTKMESSVFFFFLSFWSFCNEVFYWWWKWFNKV